jgi:two-component system sensor histidine kinase HydH
LNQALFGQRLGETKTTLLSGRSLWFAVILFVTIAAAASLVAGSRRMRRLQQTVTDTYMQAASELGRLAAGLAHEIRNPLHALRLNLHAFSRTRQDPTALEPAEINRMLEQSACEIDRIDKLLHQLIDFATPSEPRAEAFNMSAELDGVIDFIRQELRRSRVDVHLELPRVPISVCMDPARLRQIMLNLLHNARDSMPDGGRIEVIVSRRDTHVEILVVDQGCGIAEADRPHIFEPFFSSSDDGTGLGLALVKRFVQEAGGDIHCEANQPEGTRFRIRLAEATKVRDQRRR